MKSNELNTILGTGDTADVLRQVGNRIKSLRIAAGHLDYDRFAIRNDIGQSQWRRYELGNDLRFSSLLKVIAALGVTIKEFFSEGLD